MDFAFITELMNSLNSTKIFKYAFTGSKLLALAILLFKLLETTMRDLDDESNAKYSGALSILGYGLVIMTSDWIMTTIEHIFAGVDVALNTTPSDSFTTLSSDIATKLDTMFEGAEDVFDYAGIAFGNILVIISYVVAMILGALIKMADLSITASYLVVRIFIIQLLIFLFPLAIALSTFSGTQKLLGGIILRYIGVFILGIAYIGIINIMVLVQSSVLNQFDSDTGSSGVVGGAIEGGLFGIGILVAMIVTFTIKIKLLAQVTSYVNGMFQ